MRGCSNSSTDHSISVAAMLTISICVLNPMKTAAIPTKLCIAAKSCDISVTWTRWATFQPTAPPPAISASDRPQKPAPGPTCVAAIAKAMPKMP